tara:strand:- start:410 stop:784 length:375 start_codon:yes stop_codon:yes gene_type:complete
MGKKVYRETEMVSEQLEKVTYLCDICNGPIEHHKDGNGQVYWNKGHNAEPVLDDGRACDTCNAKVVVRSRISGDELTVMKQFISVLQIMEPENRKNLIKYFDIQFVENLQQMVSSEIKRREEDD